MRVRTLREKSAAYKDVGEVLSCGKTGLDVASSMLNNCCHERLDNFSKGAKLC